MLRIPFAYARENQILLRKGDMEQPELPVLIHSPLTNLAVLQEICRLMGPIVRVEQ